MRLEGLLGAETDPAADSVRGMLAAANADVMRLEGLSRDSRPMSSLMRMLATANADVMTAHGCLTAQTDETANGDVTRLMPVSWTPPMAM